MKRTLLGMVMAFLLIGEAKADDSSDLSSVVFYITCSASTEVAAANSYQCGSTELFFPAWRQTVLLTLAAGQILNLSALNTGTNISPPDGYKYCVKESDLTITADTCTQLLAPAVALIDANASLCNTHYVHSGVINQPFNVYAQHSILCVGPRDKIVSFLTKMFAWTIPYTFAGVVQPRK